MITDDELRQYISGQMNEAQRRRVAEVIDSSTEAQFRLAKMRAEIEFGESKEFEKDEGFVSLDTVAAKLSGTNSLLPPSPDPACVIGNYRLVNLIGQGGMGQVWLAEQEKPVRRQVALKLIKAGNDHQQIVARFEAERHALALMNHPSIARIFDGGTTEQGHPYFVMELVDGVPITTYCDDNIISIAGRLELFVQVCNAVQHAHQKGIIHRDLKPSNILVTVLDGKPVPKVIDFGLAKAFDHSSKLRDKSPFTEYGAIVGTLQYMSPEQAKLDSVDIDTRADVYALGILLYELLTGSTPIESESLREQAFIRVLETIREKDPPLPSDRLSSRGIYAKDIGQKRQVAPAKLSQELRGDLDWIVMKALEKDRERRYETANGFAADIERYLNSEPIMARPPSIRYRLTKFVRRHRLGVAFATAVTGLLAAGLIGTLWGLEVARARLHRAEVAEFAMEKKADELQKVVEFQANQLRTIDVERMANQMAEGIKAQHTLKLAESDLSEDAKEAERFAFNDGCLRVNFVDIASKSLTESIFSPAIKTIDNDYESMPEFQAKLFQVLGNAMQNIGIFDAALHPLEKSHTIHCQVYGEEDPKSIAAMLKLGRLYLDTGDLDRAELLLRKGKETALRVSSPKSEVYVDAIEQFAMYEESVGRFESAEASLRSALEACDSAHGPLHRVTLRVKSSLGYVLESKGNVGEAEKIFREVLENAKAKGGSIYKSEDEQIDAIMSDLNNLGSLLDARGEFEESQACFEEAYNMARLRRGDTHPLTLASLNNLAFSLTNQNKLESGEAMHRKAEILQRQVLGTTHPNTLRSMGNLSYVLRKLGRLQEAEALRRESLRLFELSLGNKHPDSLSSTVSLAQILVEQNQLDEAEKLLVFAAKVRQEILPLGHPTTLSTMNHLSSLYHSRRKLVEAIQVIRNSLAIREKTSIANDEGILQARTDLASVLIEQSQFLEAEEILKAVQLQVDELSEEYVPLQVQEALRQKTMKVFQLLQEAKHRNDLTENLE